MTGARIKQARIDQGLTQLELARRARISPKTIYEIETGNRDPSWTTAIRISLSLNVSLDYLAGLEDKK